MSHGETTWTTTVRVAAAVFAIKASTLLVLYLSSRQVGVRQSYEPFIFLKDGQTRAERLAEIHASFIERLAPYDGQYYLDIAWRGYRTFDRRETTRFAAPGNYAFFPLLPAAMELARPLGTRGAIASVAALNVILSSLAAVGVYCLAKRIGVPPWPSVLLLVTFPTSVWQCAAYTEGLFLFLSVAAALAASGAVRALGAKSSVALGVLAGLARPQGILVSTLWAQNLLRAAESRARWRAVSAAVAPFAGVAAFCIVLAFGIGAPFGFLGIQAHWARDFSWSQLASEIASPGSYVGPPLDLLALLLGVGLVPFLWRHLPPSLALFGTVSVAMPLATGTALSLGRFLSMSFPHFLCLSKLLERWPVARLALLVSFSVLHCLAAKGLIAWHFVG